MTRRIEFTVSDEIAQQYDEARGDVPLAAWIKRALEQALAGAGSPANPRTYAARTPPGGAGKSRDELAMERQAKLNKAKS